MYKAGDKCEKHLFVKKNKVLIREWAWVIVSVNSFRGMPGLKDLKGWFPYDRGSQIADRRSQ